MSISTRKVIPVSITTPTADKKIPLLKAPSDNTWTVEAVDFVFDTAIAASTADYATCQLENGGTAGTDTTDILSAVVGGTAGWAANTPKAGAVASGLGDLTAGQYLNLDWDVTGTVAANRLTVMIEISEGVGAKA